MKRLHLIHILSLILLLFIGGYFMYDLIVLAKEFGLEEEGASSRDIIRYYDSVLFLTRTYGICSLFFFAFSAFVGWRTIHKLQRTGITLLLGGIGFFIWSILMIESSSRISFHEVFPAWIAYSIIAIVLSFYGRFSYAKIPNYSDEILDDRMY